MRPTKLALVVIITAVMAAGLAPAASAVPERNRATLMEYAEDTWRSFEDMVEPSTGLVADNIEGDLDPATRSAYTSPTNIGGYLWSTVVARDLRIIDRQEAYQRMSQTLDTVARLERHADSGMFYNWYDPTTLEVRVPQGAAAADGHGVLVVEADRGLEIVTGSYRQRAGSHSHSA